MTPEQRLDRLERVVNLMVKAGLRARSQMREQGNKIDIIIDFQIHDEARFAKLTQAQTNTDRRLTELIEIVREGPNGQLK